MEPLAYGYYAQLIVNPFIPYKDPVVLSRTEPLLYTSRAWDFCTREKCGCIA